MNNTFKTRVISFNQDSMSSSEDDSDEDEPRIKRGKVNKEHHVKEMEELASQRGEEFVTIKGNSVLAKTTGPDCGFAKNVQRVLHLNKKDDNQHSLQWSPE